jgi:hypothetical protein
MTKAYVSQSMFLVASLSLFPCLFQERDGMRAILESYDSELSSSDYTHCLSFRVFQERDGMRAILESYDSELSSSDYTPQLSRRLREAEDVLTKTQNHNTEMEVWRRSVCVSVCLCLCLSQPRCLSVSLSVST